MIVIDISKPVNCDDCPCSYWIRTGEYEGQLMCNAMEFKARKNGFHEELTKHFIVREDHRPDNCPILLELVERKAINAKVFLSQA